MRKYPKRSSNLVWTLLIFVFLVALKFSGFSSRVVGMMVSSVTSPYYCNRYSILSEHICQLEDNPWPDISFHSIIRMPTTYSSYCNNFTDHVVLAKLPCSLTLITKDDMMFRCQCASKLARWLGRGGPQGPSSPIYAAVYRNDLGLLCFPERPAVHYWGCASFCFSRQLDLSKLW